MQTQLSLSAIGQIIRGEHDNPSSLLGAHPIDYRGEPATAVRSYLPDAKAAWIVDTASGQKRPMRQIHPAGFFEAICEGTLGSTLESTANHADAGRGSSHEAHSRYRIQMTNENGETVEPAKANVDAECRR